MATANPTISLPQPTTAHFSLPTPKEYGLILGAMSKICQICGKGYLKGNQVPRGVGRRVTRRTIIRQQPNLRSKKLEINGTSIKVQMCASCLKRMGFDARAAAVIEAAAAESASN